MTSRTKAQLALSVCGFLLNGLLLYWKLSGGHDIAGCGGGHGCETVMASRWSMVGHVPVAALGVMGYAVLAFALISKKRVIAIACCAAIAGSALWFIGVQIIAIGRYCGWCLAGHAIGLAVAGLGLWSESKNPALLPSSGVGVLSAMMLVVAQFLLPVPTRIVTENRTAVETSGDVHAEGKGRLVLFDDGRKVFNADTLPSIGDPAATHVLVEYFDYLCPACRTMSGHLAALVAKHPQDVCVLVLPVPLETSCNPYLTEADHGHAGSCDMARAALAVWRTKPEAFPAIHAAMFSQQDPALAVEQARKAIGPQAFDAALRDPWIDRVIKADVGDWHALSSRTRHLPKLLISGNRVLHGLPSGQAEFIEAIEKELGL